MLGECPTTVVEADLHLEHVVAGRVGEGKQVTRKYERGVWDSNTASQSEVTNNPQSQPKRD